MIHGQSGMGMTKHGKSGKAHKSEHFTGIKKGKRVRRTGKGLTRKQRHLRRGTHKNKYET
jgi:hypothetical protein